MEIPWNPVWHRRTFPNDESCFTGWRRIRAGGMLTRALYTNAAAGTRGRAPTADDRGRVPCVAGAAGRVHPARRPRTGAARRARLRAPGPAEQAPRNRPSRRRQSRQLNRPHAGPLHLGTSEHESCNPSGTTRVGRRDARKSGIIRGFWEPDATPPFTDPVRVLRAS